MVGLTIFISMKLLVYLSLFKTGYQRVYFQVLFNNQYPHSSRLKCESFEWPGSAKFRPTTPFFVVSAAAFGCRLIGYKGSEGFLKLASLGRTPRINEGVNINISESQRSICLDILFVVSNIDSLFYVTKFVRRILIQFNQQTQNSLSRE